MHGFRKHIDEVRTDAECANAREVSAIALFESLPVATRVVHAYPHDTRASAHVACAVDSCNVRFLSFNEISAT